MPRVRVGDRELNISHLDKVFWPADGITKGRLIDYYNRIADRMLPFLEDRPLAMQRFPDGINGESFYQKDMPDYFPEWIRRVAIEEGTGTNSYVVCDDDATLVFLADTGCITPHIWQSRAENLRFPDRLVFDLDPSDKQPAGFSSVVAGAFLVRAVVEDAGLEAYVMTTGGKGLHVVVPLDGKDDYSSVRGFAAGVAGFIERAYPDEYTGEIRKDKRRGRVFIDVLRNGFGSLAVPPYAVRAYPGAPVATPLSWEELKKPGLTSRDYTISNIWRRLARRKDPWAGFREESFSIKKARSRLPF
jgi:bifunctional non-homologous end joining protein LigD